MLIAAFVSLYLNVRKPREILQDWGTLGSSVAWASGPGYPVPAGREGRLRPVPRGTTPDRSAPAAAWGLRSTFRPIRPKRLGGRPAGPTRCGGAEGEPESPCPTLSTPFPPSRVSGWPGRVFEEEFGLRDPRRRAVIYSPQPSQQTSKRGGGDPPPDAWRRDPTVSTQRQAGKPPGGSYISHPTYDRRAGVSRSSPRGCAFLPLPPPASAPPAAPLPRPVLGAQRLPSRAAPRGAESSRAATRAASPV